MSIQPGYSNAGELLLTRAGELADWIVDRQYDLQPELMERYGPIGKVKTRQDTLYSLQFLAESVMVDSPKLFVQYISWLKILLEGFGITSQDLVINLRLTDNALEELLEHPGKTMLRDHLLLGIERIKEPEEYPSFIRQDNPLYEEARKYLDLLSAGNRREALELVEGLLENEVAIKDIYKYIFQITQYEIGRLWQMGDMNVAQEHFCTAATQFIMSSLYGRWIVHSRDGYRLLATCVGQEQHEIGIRMIADFFEMEGWNTYYLGANVPQRNVIEAIIDYSVDLVALSATMAFHVHLIKDLIVAIRADERTTHVKIMVGGQPFNMDARLWHEVGADGFAIDADQAVKAAADLLSHIAQGGSTS
ncbi:B12-binding domain-containing protein [Paenibacillus massiliensis]|uniref:cobalamin B12-binding domain-containing protein n=1 Tax=Paenibacillus massiliensis TaxID=225917 RepID=UPI000472163C|nr:cobalamin-dependent protein [Paenibacillus massiliensis]